MLSLYQISSNTGARLTRIMPRVLLPLFVPCAATPLFAIQNTVHNWDAPAQYRPERWLDVPVEAYVYDSTTNTTGGEHAT